MDFLDTFLSDLETGNQAIQPDGSISRFLDADPMGSQVTTHGIRVTMSPLYMQELCQQLFVTSCNLTSSGW